MSLHGSQDPYSILLFSLRVNVCLLCKVQAAVRSRAKREERIYNAILSGTRASHPVPCGP